MSGVVTERQPTLGFDGRGTATPCSSQIKPSVLVAYQISDKSQSADGIVSLQFFAPCGGAGVFRRVYQT